MGAIEFFLDSKTYSSLKTALTPALTNLPLSGAFLGNFLWFQNELTQSQEKPTETHITHFLKRMGQSGFLDSSLCTHTIEIDLKPTLVYPNPSNNQEALENRPDLLKLGSWVQKMGAGVRFLALWLQKTFLLGFGLASLAFAGVLVQNVGFHRKEPFFSPTRERFFLWEKRAHFCSQTNVLPKNMPPQPS